MSIIRGTATPAAAKIMWKPSDISIWTRAAVRPSMRALSASWRWLLAHSVYGMRAGGAGL